VSILEKFLMKNDDNDRVQQLALRSGSGSGMCAGAKLFLASPAIKFFTFLRSSTELRRS